MKSGHPNGWQQDAEISRRSARRSVRRCRSAWTPTPAGPSPRRCGLARACRSTASTTSSSRSSGTISPAWPRSAAPRPACRSWPTKPAAPSRTRTRSSPRKPPTCSASSSTSMAGSRRRGRSRRIAEAANIKINCGGLAVLSQLEAAAGAHFYASRPAAHVMPAGEFIFGSASSGRTRWCRRPILSVKDGHVTPPSGPGLGITIDERALDALTRC